MAKIVFGRSRCSISNFSKWVNSFCPTIFFAGLHFCFYFGRIANACGNREIYVVLFGSLDLFVFLGLASF